MITGAASPPTTVVGIGALRRVDKLSVQGERTDP